MFTRDLFTCIKEAGLEVTCFGASHEGFFGSPEACPAHLKDAWPTLHGPVAAPHAACSSVPVKITAASFERHWSSSPSACAVRDGGVECRGEGYSPAEALEAPVRVSLDLPPSPPFVETAMVAPTAVTGFSARCLARHGCKRSVVRAPPCTSDVPARDWAALAGEAPSLVGRRVTARGALFVGPLSKTMMDCEAPDGIACCNRMSAPVVMVGPRTLLLDRMGCAGDDSALCCNAPAYGQTVVATGLLEPAHGPFDPMGSPYKLVDVALCTAH